MLLQGLFRQHPIRPNATISEFRRTDVNHRHIHETPGRSLGLTQQMARLSVDPVLGINPRRGGHPGRDPIPRSCDNANWHAIHNQSPILPAMKLRKVVGTHQPHKPDLWIQALQRCQCIRCCPRAGLSLNIRHCNARVLHDRSGRFKSTLQRGWALFLQRISRRHQPPDPVQPKGFHRFASHMHVAPMRRVKRPSEQADNLTRPRKWYGVSLHPLLMFRTEPPCQSTGCTASA